MFERLQYAPGISSLLCLPNRSEGIHMNGLLHGLKTVALHTDDSIIE